MAWQNFWPVSPGLENRINHELTCVTVFSILFAARAVFIHVSKSNWFRINYASWLAENNLHLFFIQSEVNPKLIMTHACRPTCNYFEFYCFAVSTVYVPCNPIGCILLIDKFKSWNCSGKVVLKTFTKA